jgi:hypothetical protein
MSRFRAVISRVAVAALLTALGGCRSVGEGEKSEAPAVRAAREAKEAAAGIPAPPHDAAPLGEIDEKQFDADVRELTKNPHRLSGRADGSVAASRYVEGRLAEMGFVAGESLFVQEFPVVQPRQTQCELVVDEQRHAIYGMRPNILHAPVTKEEGISGETMYVGRGEVGDYGSRTAEDKIVVLDFDCERNWLKAFAFGARAVLFIGQEGAASSARHHLNVPANLPRFYVPAELAEKLELTRRPRQVKLLAACEWEQLRGRSVIAVLRGTSPIFTKELPEAIVLAAPLDSLSEVPELSPGAREAANCAALLQIADSLRTHRPKRDVVLCFFDGQTQGHAGARAFYGGLFRRMGASRLADASLEDRLEMLDKERTYLQTALEILDQEDIYQANATANSENVASFHKSVLIRVRTEARVIGSEVLDDLREIRLSLRYLESDKKAAEKQDRAVPEIDRRIDELRQERARLEVEDLAWNSLQRVIHENVDPENSEKVAGLFAGMVETNIRGKKDLEAIAAEASKLDPRDRDDFDAIYQKHVAAAEKGDGRLRLNLIRREMLKHITPMRFTELIAHSRTVFMQRLREVESLRKETELAVRLRDTVGQERNTIVLHLGLHLGDARTRWTFVHGDDGVPMWEDKVGNYSAVFKAILRVRDDLNGSTLKKDHVTDWAGFCAALAGGAPETAPARVWRRMDDKTRTLVQAAAARDLTDNEKQDILRSVSASLNRTDFFTTGDFDGAELADEDRAILARVGQAGADGATVREALWPEQVVRLNRLALERAVGKAVSASPARRTAPDFESRGATQTYDSRMFAPGLFTDSGSIARLFAKFNLSVMTVLDRQGRQGQPADTREALDLPVMMAQVRQVIPMLKGLADDSGMSLSLPIRPEARFGDAKWSGVKSSGPAVRRVGAGSVMRPQPVRGAVVAMIPDWKWGGHAVDSIPPGFEYPLRFMTDTNGIFEVPSHHYGHYLNGLMFAATFDRKSAGESGSGERRGILSAVTDAKTIRIDDVKRTAVSLARVRSKTIVGYGFERGALPTTAMRALSTSRLRMDRHQLCESENILTLFAPYDARGMKLFNRAGLVVLDNENSEEGYRGMGIALDDEFDHPIPARTTAHDLRTLNQYRLDLLRKNRINQESLELLNARAKDLADDALAAAPGSESPVTTDKYYGDLEAAGAYARRAYTPLVGVMNDLVTAVVLLLLLAMPFAYAIERLVIGTPHIYRQIGWFIVFFLITFGLLFLVNPAFRIATTPVIIFLAFAIILLSSLVIFIMMRKLQTEIRKMQGLSSTVHSMDVSRLSTMMAAVMMGISTMRRRPLRTFLTAATVVLLTFTILTFASFGSSWGARRTYEGPLSGLPPRVLVRHQLWSPIGEGVHETLRGHLSGEAVVVPRYWVSPTAQEAEDAVKQNVTLEVLVTDGEARRAAPLTSAIGLDRRDVEIQPDLKALFAPEARIDLLDKDGIFLTGAVCKELGIRPEDAGIAKVIFKGMVFTFAGRMREQLDAHTMLEGSKLLPVDYQASGGGSAETFTQAQASESLSEMPDIESAQFVYYGVDRVVVISAAVARTLRGRIRSISIYPTDPEKIEDIAERVASITEFPTYLGHRGGVYRLIFTSLAKASGWRDLLIPVILGGLIVFATMLGSVSDREREIYTFSSLGLAPPHVSSLFFAEAAMYAVIGGMGGYLLGQGVARGLGILAGYGIVSVPAMNYSSTNAIVTILIVMGTVLISTIYPAVKASRSANPGIQRSWRIPKPEGNLYDLIFPFTVSAYDITGVVSFLKEHFGNYTDTSLGVFATTECHVFRQKDNDMLGIRATVALAPFDLGVNQRFALLSQPSEIEGIDEVRILIHRLSGAQGDWQRSNRVFINDLRKQLLIWRALTTEVMDQYRQATLEQWEQLSVEQMDGQTIGESA